MSKEVKVGLLALVALAVSYWGYKFILGQNLLKKSNTYLVYYPTVDQLQVGTLAYINGVPVGSVSNVELINNADRTVMVTLNLQPDISIPKDTRAVIVVTGFMGGNAVLLEYDTPCTGEDCAQSGDILAGETKGMMKSMMGEDDLQAYMSIFQKSLQDVVDSLNHALLSEDSDSPLAKSVRNLDATLSNLSSATGQLDNLLRNSSGSIRSSLSSVEGITSNLERNNDKINSILANADSLTSQLAAADLSKTVAEINATIQQLKGTLEKADAAMGSLSSIATDINQGEGSLGKLLKDEELYNNINDLSNRADSLINDFQDRPYRYMPLKSRRRVERYDRLDAEEN